MPESRGDSAIARDAIADAIMRRLSRGNVSLQIGRVVTSDEIEVLRARVNGFDWQDTP